MSDLDTYKKQAKQLVRWHREGNYSIGGRIRGLTRYGALTDREALALRFPLSEAQEIIALEAGYASWSELKTALAKRPATTARPKSEPTLLRAAVPVLFVSDVEASANFYAEQLGFDVDFLHGNPPFYGAVSRDGAILHLRFVHEPVFVAQAAERESLIMAFIQVQNVKDLYGQLAANGLTFQQKLRKEAWGGPAFIVADPDGNSICFAG
jgi:catechol 2,3-dioxygenase-like lactoylglutathione lyase family enzyme